jgi:hypothetical protein
MPQQTKSRSGRISNGDPSRPSGSTVADTKNTGSQIASTAEQLKTPAIAAGVGLVGLVGGIAVGRATNQKGFNVPPRGRSAVKRTSKTLSSAAKNVGTLAEQTGQIAERVRLASEALAGKHEQHTAPRRSPIEVLLEALTRRSLPRA